MFDISPLKLGHLPMLLTSHRGGGTLILVAERQVEQPLRNSVKDTLDSVISTVRVGGRFHEAYWMEEISSHVLPESVTLLMDPVA